MYVVHCRGRPIKLSSTKKKDFRYFVWNISISRLGNSNFGNDQLQSTTFCTSLSIPLFSLATRIMRDTKKEKGQYKRCQFVVNLENLYLTFRRTLKQRTSVSYTKKDIKLSQFLL